MRPSPFVLIFAAVALGWMPARAEEASFDCLKATAPIEQLICSDPQLLTLDAALGDAFAAHRQRLPEKDRAGALAEQRAWLAERLKQCGVPAKGEEVPPELRWRTAPCLDEMYRTRLAALGAPAEAPPPLPQLAESGFIHPACLLTIIEQDPQERAASPPHIPLAACARGNRHIPVSAGNEGSFSAPGAADGYPTWLSYRLLGNLPDGRDVAVVWYNSGGTGQFSELYLLRRAPTPDHSDVVLSGELIGGGGDRCNGGVEQAKLVDARTLEVDYWVTPLDLLSEVDEDVAERAFDDLLSCAICCIGTVRRRLDVSTSKETTFSATITQFPSDEMASGGPRSVQACFDGLVRKAAGPLPHTFSGEELRALAAAFAKTCLKT
jgi:uncharacterized protein YecT (DUF1311 family)